ncbi:thiol-disulfide oxidoreductase LTO1-like isoform X1 [Andrographis paniculata]|uniref:thiol-disulfide oxidoreductase LTO1-like isoform X1 n=1 Tax=Andrographis paniculata TaxID=175694 RepID=UPI0021E94782|nr:thiol-disulfide oxidoreductase LTO1-like isoform X1 [Andrographis paniculata]
MTMATPANFFVLTSSSLPCDRSPSPSLTPVYSRNKRGALGCRFRLLKVHCASECGKDDAAPESESEFKYKSEPDARLSFLSRLLLEASSIPCTLIGEDNGCSSAYKWYTVLGGIGFLETAYLTYLKITDSVDFCLTGGDAFSAILTSDHSSVFGAPLPLFGMLGYGLVAILGLQRQLGPRKAFGIEKIDGELILTGTTTSMAVASAYFLYVLSTEFVGQSCVFFLASAALSFSLFFITLKDFGFKKMQKILGSKLCVAALLSIALTASCYVVQPVPSSLAETEMAYTEAEITKESSPLALSLARHLHSIGAKLYGAFWCSHCVDQKQMFGHEAAKLLDYVECYPDGVREGTKMAKVCSNVELKGFPSWEINGQVYSGRKQLAELARLSGFDY